MNRIELDIEIDEEIYYSDSKVVLGYIQNESRGFYVHNATAPSQGRYIDTARNPADLATLCVTPQLETDRIAMDTGTLISMESAAPASSFTPGGMPQQKKPKGWKGKSSPVPNQHTHPKVLAVRDLSAFPAGPPWGMQL